MERGAYNTDAYHDHYPLFTGPGHSIHLTGAPPYKTGIVGNDWFDRALNAERYCVEDTKSPLVGAADPDGKRGVSPATLRVSTVGDELKMATGGQAKVWGIAFKDRAAILMAGHLADGVLWFDDETGTWISSRFYFRDGHLPGWVTDWNAAKRVDPYFGKTWSLSVPPADIARRVALGFHPAVSGDVVIVLDPYTVPNYGKGAVATGTTHGTPYAYDTSVPLLLAGAGIKPGRYTARVSTLDIAPTLSDLLGILQPSGCEGHVLSQSLR